MRYPFKRGFIRRAGQESYSIEQYGDESIDITIVGLNGTVYLSGEDFDFIAKAVKTFRKKHDEAK